MGRKCVCKICGKQLDTDTAYKRIINGHNFYYCSESEYNKKQQEIENRNWIINYIYDVMGYKCTNTLINKEISGLSKLYSFDIIKQFILDNSDKFDYVRRKTFNNEHGHIRYIFAIIKNNIGDYKPKAEVKEIKNFISIDEGYETKYKPKATRRNFEDIEGEI